MQLDRKLLFHLNCVEKFSFYFYLDRQSLPWPPVNLVKTLWWSYDGKSKSRIPHWSPKQSIYFLSVETIFSLKSAWLEFPKRSIKVCMLWPSSPCQKPFKIEGGRGLIPFLSETSEPSNIRENLAQLKVNLKPQHSLESQLETAVKLVFRLRKISLSYKMKTNFMSLHKQIKIL